MVKKSQVVQSKAKRKTAIARVRVRKGMGAVRVNSRPLNEYGSEFARSEIAIPFSVGEDVLGKGFAENLDIDVDVRGGGFMGQAEAVKTAIAKALVGWTDSDELRKAYLMFDRNLLVDDVRRRETKKPLGRGARKKRQKSYR